MASATISNGSYSVRQLTKGTMLFSSNRSRDNHFLLSAGDQQTQASEDSSRLPTLSPFSQNSGASLQMKYQDLIARKNTEDLLEFLAAYPEAIKFLLKDPQATPEHKANILGKLQLSGLRLEVAKDAVEQDAENIPQDALALFEKALMPKNQSSPSQR